MNRHEKVLTWVGLIGIALVLGLFIFLQPAKADYLLGVYKKEEILLKRDEAVPLATKNFIAFSDCRWDRKWIIGLIEQIEPKTYYVVCDYEEWMK